MKPQLIWLTHIRDGEECEDMCAVGAYIDEDPDHVEIDPHVYHWFLHEDDLQESLGNEMWSGDVFVSYKPYDGWMFR